MDDDEDRGRLARRERVDHPRRTSTAIALVLLGVLIFAGVSGFRYYRSCGGAAEVEPSPVTFVVPDGATATEVVDELQAHGVTPCGGFVGNLLMRGTGKSADILAGTYELTTGMSLDDAVAVLTTVPDAVPTVRLTIPPGYRLTQIADRVEKTLGIPADTFLERANSGEFALPPYLPEGTPTSEGFLYPETYRIRGTATADEVIQRLIDQFSSERASLPWKRAKGLGVSPYEVVTIASMIEKEAKIQKDRPLIAGVIYNRLRDGMPLGIDATSLYDDPTPDGELSTADLETDGPYNTRLRAGLPPTPIASPYRWSLAAALKPADTPYYYYVLCGDDGGHRFAVTYAQHLRNVDECLG